MSATQQTLAQLVRSKYPGSYDDMDDATLEKNVLAKYPEYSDLPRTQAQQQPIQQNLKTGAGMEAQSQKQAGQYLQQQATAPYEQQQAELQSRKNRAMNMQNASITPFTNASMAYFPAASARMLAGSKVGSVAGGQIGKQISPEGEQYGQFIGGTIGGIGASLPWNQFTRANISQVVRDPLTGRVRTPWEIAIDKALPDPNAPEAVPAKTIPKGTNYGQYLTDQKVAARAAAQAAKNAPKPLPVSPFAGAVSSAQPGGAGLQLPEATAPQQPFPQVTKAGAPAQTKILSPSAPEARFSGSEGRAATWTNEDVMRLAQQGNREAISQAIRRGMQLPANARYVMGDPDLPRAVYNPREVTQFTPEGQPIRNMQNPTAPPSPKARIQLPWQQGSVAQPREVISAQTGEVTTPLRPEVQQMAMPSAAAKVPEWQAGQRDFEIARLKNVLRNPQATAEERAIAQSQLKNYGGVF